MTVLILAQEFDPTADAVVGALAQHQVPVFRTDLSDFPSRLRLDAQLRDGRWSGRLWNDHCEVELDGVRSIWNRNPFTYAGLDFVVTPDECWVMLEANSGPQFGWLEAATGAPMVAAMADLLMKANV